MGRHRPGRQLVEVARRLPRLAVHRHQQRRGPLVLLPAVRRRRENPVVPGRELRHVLLRDLLHELGRAVVQPPDPRDSIGVFLRAAQVQVSVEGQAAEEAGRRRVQRPGLAVEGRQRVPLARLLVHVERVHDPVVGHDLPEVVGRAAAVPGRRPVRPVQRLENPPVVLGLGVVVDRQQRAREHLQAAPDRPRVAVVHHFPVASVLRAVDVAAALRVGVQPAFEFDHRADRLADPGQARRHELPRRIAVQHALGLVPVAELPRVEPAREGLQAEKPVAVAAADRGALVRVLDDRIRSGIRVSGILAADGVRIVGRVAVRRVTRRRIHRVRIRGIVGRGVGRIGTEEAGRRVLVDPGRRRGLLSAAAHHQPPDNGDREYLLHAPVPVQGPCRSCDRGTALSGM